MIIPFPGSPPPINQNLRRQREIEAEGALLAERINRLQQALMPLLAKYQALLAEYEYLRMNSDE